MARIEPDPSMPALPEAAEARVQALEQAVRARDDFLAIAAHELRSPLNALALRIDLLERIAVAHASPQLVEEIRRVRRSADRCVRRATVLLDVTRLNSGELEPARAPVDVRTLVAEVMDMHADEAKLLGVALHADVKGDGIGQWDPHMTEQILSNLVTNGIKYGHGSPVHVRAAVDASAACFEVSDQGPGIDAAHQARIFEKFERVVSGAKYRSGYGLGLWIVGSMVRAHAGTISIDSAPGRGSLFKVRLPLGASQENKEQP